MERSDDGGEPQLDPSTTGPDSGAGPGHRSRPSLRDRVVRWGPGAGLTLVAIAALLVGGMILFDVSLDRVSVGGLAEDGDVARPGEADRTIAIDDDDAGASPRELATALHVLVVGSDDRSVLTPDERREYSTGDAAGERMEAIALVRIDPHGDRVDVLRLPRDLLVTRCDGSRGRINAAYGIGEREGIGGATCLVDTITSWTGIPIHHVVKVDFRGFVDVVDAVGGIEVAIDEPLLDERAGLDVPAGCVHLDGVQALAFVRARHLDDDFGRIGRQQQLVAATLDQVLTASTLSDPRRLGKLLTTAQRSLQMDDRMTAHRMRAIAATVARLDSDRMVTRTVDGDVRLSDGGVSFLYPHEEHAEELFAAFVAGDLDTTPPARGEDPDAVDDEAGPGGGTDGEEDVDGDTADGATRRGGAVDSNGDLTDRDDASGTRSAALADTGC